MAETTPRLALQESIKNNKSPSTVENFHALATSIIDFRKAMMQHEQDYQAAKEEVKDQKKAVKEARQQTMFNTLRQEFGIEPKQFDTVYNALLLVDTIKSDRSIDYSEINILITALNSLIGSSDWSNTLQGLLGELKTLAESKKSTLEAGKLALGTLKKTVDMMETEKKVPINQTESLASLRHETGMKKPSQEELYHRFELMFEGQEGVVVGKKASVDLQEYSAMKGYLEKIKSQYPDMIVDQYITALNELESLAKNTETTISNEVKTQKSDPEKKAIQEQASENKDISDLWRKEAWGKIIEKITEFDDQYAVDIQNIAGQKNIKQILNKLSEALGKGMSLDGFIKEAVPLAKGKPSIIDHQIGRLFTAATNNSALRSLVAFFPSKPPLNVVMMAIKGKPFQNWEISMSDFDGSGTTIGLSIGSDNLSKKERYAQVRTIDHLGGLTGTMMVSMIETAISSPGMTEEKVKQNLASYLSTIAPDFCQKLFGTKDLDLTKQKVFGTYGSLAYLQQALAKLGSDEAMKVMLGTQKKETKSFNWNEMDQQQKEEIVKKTDIDVANLTTEQQQQLQEKLNTLTETCYQKLKASVQKVAETVGKDPSLSPQQKKSQIDQLMKVYNNPQQYAGDIQKLAWSSMISAAQGYAIDQMLAGAGAGAQQMLKFLTTKAGDKVMVTMAENAGFAVLPGLNGVGISMALTIAGTKVKQDGSIRMASLTASASVALAKGFDIKKSISGAASFTVTSDRLLNKNANSKEGQFLSQEMVRTANYGGGYAYVDLGGIGAGLYIRRDKEKGINDKRQAIEKELTGYLKQFKDISSLEDLKNKLKSGEKTENDTKDSKDKTPKITTLTDQQKDQLAQQLFELILMVQQKPVTEQAAFINQLAQRAAGVWESQYRTSERRGIVLNAASLGIKIGIFQAAPLMLDAGVSLGWIKGLTLRADDSADAMKKLRNNLLVMNNAQEMDKDWDTESIGKLNQSLGLIPGMGLKFEEKSEKSVVGTEKKSRYLTIPKAVLEKPDDRIAFLADPRYVSFVKKEANGDITLPSVLLNRQVIHLADGTKNQVLCIGLGGDRSTIYNDLDLSTVTEKGDPGKWGEVLDQNRFADARIAVKNYLEVPPKGKTEAMTTTLEKCGMQFAKDDKGNYVMETGSDGKVSLFMKKGTRFVTKEVKDKGGALQEQGDFYKIPLQGKLFISKSVTDNQYTASFLSDPKDQAFTIAIDQTLQEKLASNYVDNLNLGVISQEVQTFITQHDNIIKMRFQKTKSGYIFKSRPEYKAFNNAMEMDLSIENNLENAQNLCARMLTVDRVNIAPDLKTNQLGYADLRGILQAGCLVTNTENKSFTSNSEFDNKKLELKKSLAGKRNSKNPTLDSFFDSFQSNTIIDSADKANFLSNLIDGKFTDKKSHRGQINDVEYKVYWMFSGVSWVENLRVKNGFYDKLLSMSHKDYVGAKDSFTQSYKKLLNRKEAAKIQVTKLYDVESIQSQLKDKDPNPLGGVDIDDVTIYPNSVSMIYGGDETDPDMKFIHHGMFIKGLSEKIGNTEGDQQRKKHFLDKMQKTEYFQYYVNLVLGGVKKNHTYDMLDSNNVTMNDEQVKKEVYDMLLTGKKVKLIKVGDNPATQGAIKTAEGTPSWTDNYFVQCINPTENVSLGVTIDSDYKQQEQTSITISPCPDPKPFQAFHSQGVQLSTQRNSFGFGASTKIKNAPEQPEVYTLPGESKPLTKEEIKAIRDAGKEILDSKNASSFNKDVPFPVGEYLVKWYKADPTAYGRAIQGLKTQAQLDAFAASIQNIINGGGKVTITANILTLVEFQSITSKIKQMERTRQAYEAKQKAKEKATQTTSATPSQAPTKVPQSYNNVPVKQQADDGFGDHQYHNDVSSPESSQGNQSISQKQQEVAPANTEVSPPGKPTPAEVTPVPSNTVEYSKMKFSDKQFTAETQKQAGSKFLEFGVTERDKKVYSKVMDNPNITEGTLIQDFYRLEQQELNNLTSGQKEAILQERLRIFEKELTPNTVVVFGKLGCDGCEKLKKHYNQESGTDGIKMMYVDISDRRNEKILTSYFKMSDQILDLNRPGVTLPMMALRSEGKWTDANIGIPKTTVIQSGTQLYDAWQSEESIIPGLVKREIFKK